MEEKIKIELLKRTKKETDCPICSLVTDYEFDLLAKIQFQIAYNENVRNSLALDGGFCDFHFRRFKKISSGKTKILLLKSLVEKADLSRFNFMPKCTVCYSIDKYEKELIKTELELLKRNDFKKLFSESLGLCFAHLRNLIDVSDSTQLNDWLTNINTLQFKRTLADIDEMLKIKSFYEVAPEKRRLINSLIQKLAGRETRGL